ncbi:hypothetical protein BDB01DRAFT_788693 [Pilobolus umbonatus]|nr:hypothetical protein BDB01DRAFT_788693 [Pilobolus umbonatus]
MDTNINNTMDTDNSNTMDTDNSNTMNTDNSNTMDTTINNTVDTEHTSNDNEDREMSYKRDLFLSISEEERVEKLERTIVDIQSQMNTIISYPPSSPSSSNESIPTVLSENNTLGKDQTDSPPTLPTELRRNRSTDQSSFYQSLQMKLSPTYHISPHRTQRLMNKPVNNKPSDQHMASMRQIVEMIPTVQLKTTDIIVGPDGITRPNPFWIEMYGSKRRTL